MSTVLDKRETPHMTRCTQCGVGVWEEQTNDKGVCFGCLRPPLVMPDRAEFLRRRFPRNTNRRVK